MRELSVAEQRYQAVLAVLGEARHANELLKTISRDNTREGSKKNAAVTR
jgi:hypothetical protein